jgi:holo-[acyl-carrier protein] synthase
MEFSGPPAFSFSEHKSILLVGFDLVKISGIEDSVRDFGDRFKQRLFTAAELDYVHSGEARWAERLAARFAAKEATIKALKLADAGINWRDIEVCRLPDGACELALHGRVANLAKQLEVSQMALSLSHDGDYAGAVVNILCRHVEPQQKY